MHGCAVRKRNMRKGSQCCCTVVHKQTGNIETSGRTHAPLILVPQALARAGPDSLDPPNALIPARAYDYKAMREMVIGLLRQDGHKAFDRSCR